MENKHIDLDYLQKTCSNHQNVALSPVLEHNQREVDDPKPIKGGNFGSGGCSRARASRPPATTPWGGAAWRGTMSMP